MWRKLRIFLLLFVLATVGQQAWLREQDLDWGNNFYVALYPVNADGSPAVATYLASLKPEQFEPLTEYFAAEAQRYGLSLYHPFEIRLGPAVSARPPLPPRPASMLQAVSWSLRFRWWAWQHSPRMPVKPQIRLYLLYHDAATTASISHSTALSKGRISLVNLYGAPNAEAQNLVIVAHELLHTVGATDKYEAASNQPRFPEGYVEPDKQPRYPQAYAELMAGRIPLSESRAEIPDGLPQTRIGPATAREIGWMGKR